VPTAADGAFRIGPVRDPWQFLFAWKPGVGAGDGGQALRGAHVVIRLVPVARLEGRLVDAGDGSPIAGASAVTRSAGGGWNHEETRTDAGGRFVLDTCDPDEAYLWIRTAEHGAVVLTPFLRPGETTALEIPLSRQALARGRVVDAGTGQPVALERVWDPSNPAREARLLGDGRFEVAGGDSLRVRAPGYPDTSIPGRFDEARPYELERGKLLRVFVSGEDGEPVAGASVHVSLLREATRRETDGAGVAELYVTKRQASDAEASAMVQAHGRGQARAELGAWAGDVKEIAFRLVRGAVVEGTVREREGALVPGARVQIGDVYAATGADGRFRLEGVAPGDVALRIESPLHAPLERAHVLVPERALDLGVLELDPGASIEGRLVDGEGRVVHAQAVFVEKRRGVVRADGTFAVGGLVAGRAYTVRAGAGMATASAEALGGDRDVLVRFDAEASLGGRVRAPEGERLPVKMYANVARRGEFRRGPGPEARVRTDGALLVRGIGAGSWELRITAPGSGFAPITTTFDLAAGERKELDLRFERGGVVVVHVARGGYAGRLLVGLRSDGDRYGLPQTADAAGVVRFDELPAGVFDVAVAHTDPSWCAAGRTTVTVEAGRETACALAIVRTGALLVHAAPGAALALEDATGRAVHAIADAAGTDGTWRRAELTPGTYFVVAGDVRRRVEVCSCGCR
jgi:hypothetical protein